MAGGNPAGRRLRKERQAAATETNMFGYGGMMSGFGLLGGGIIWLLVLIVLVLSIAALIKYLRS
jgi:hypothetical protein